VIADRLLIAGEAFSARLGTQRVLDALLAGILDTGAPTPDTLALEHLAGPDGALVERLHELHVDARMREARALVIAVASLSPDTLVGSIPFELATRARQGGIPAYAITAANGLDSFDQRILDLQVVLEARSARELEASGRLLVSLA
jgi:hypothetical protein